MTTQISAINAPQAYIEAMWAMRMNGYKEDTERGEVLRIPGISILEIFKPTERVVFDPGRNANPFFHVMEFVWMMAGNNNSAWIAQFNRNILNSAEPDGKIRGAYGSRWEHGDQVYRVCELLKKSPNTRRAVLSMWEAGDDLSPGFKDYPCNTHIYLGRDPNGKLDMTVCNRSNDLVWGMLGANIVHMTMLHEVISSETKIDLGVYRVVTNNLHMYTSIDRFDQMLGTLVEVDRYALPHEPILRDTESYSDFADECRYFISGRFDLLRNTWLISTALPIHQAYMERIHKRGDGFNHTMDIASTDWRIACQEWIQRKTLSSAT